LLLQLNEKMQIGLFRLHLHSCEKTKSFFISLELFFVDEHVNYT